MTNPTIANLIKNVQTNLTTENTTMTESINNNQVQAMTESAKASAMSQVLFSKGLTPVQSLALAAIFMNKEHMIGDEMWEVNIEVAFGEVKVMGEAVDMPANWFEVLTSANLITQEAEVGTYLEQLNSLKDKAYPTVAGLRTERTRSIMPTVKSTSLMTEAVQALEATEYQVDTFILEVAHRVFANADCDEAYVVSGCDELVKRGNVPVTSEFFADARGRLYQGDCHGPNGQSSDMARALMNLCCVGTDYDVKKVMPVLLAEMEDMTYNHLSVMDAMAVLTNVGAVAFVQGEFVSKPWSFLKAANIMFKLEKGAKPYIGMAFGLDAKCSGPQYGAIMTGDKDIAQACGFTTVAVDDAYQRAIANFGKLAGLFTRDLIKKPYMGIFYGQSALAFADEANYGTQPSDHAPELLPVMKSLNAIITDFHGFVAVQNNLCPQLVANAYAFHRVVEGSFGEMAKLRDRIKAAHSYRDDLGNIIMKTNAPTKHMMPDGLEIAMKYMVKVDILGRTVEAGSIAPDVSVVIGLTDMKFNQMKFKTTEFALYDYARTGFVNMIQGTDALVARHIVAELDRDDAQHIVAVHDCFRVNINDFIAGKLHSAIKQAYLNCFANTSADILGQYFKGVNDAGSDCTIVSQIVSVTRGENIVKYNRAQLAGLNLKEMIMDLENKLDGTGNTYYFAK
jgi:hypothetical protein